MQKSKTKMQNDKEKFKKDFIKRLVKFSIKIVNLGEKMRKKKLSWSIVNQLIDSATSVGANVVEARASSSKKDYTHFFEIALKSANETKYWLIVIRESYSQFEKEAKDLLKEINEIANILGSSVLTLKGRKK